MCWFQLLVYQFGFCSSGSASQQILIGVPWWNNDFCVFIKLFGVFLFQKDPLEYMKLVGFSHFLFAESNYQIILAFGWVKFVKPKTKSFFYNESLFFGYYKVTACHFFQMNTFQCLKQFFPIIWIWWIKLSNQFAFGWVEVCHIDTHSILHSSKSNHKVTIKYSLFLLSCIHVNKWNNWFFITLKW